MFFPVRIPLVRPFLLLVLLAAEPTHALNGSWHFEGFRQQATRDGSDPVRRTSGSVSFEGSTLSGLSIGGFTIDAPIPLDGSSGQFAGNREESARAEGGVKNFEERQGDDGSYWVVAGESQPEFEKFRYRVSISRVPHSDPEFPETYVFCAMRAENHLEYIDKRTVAAVTDYGYPAVPELESLVEVHEYTRAADGVFGILRRNATALGGEVSWRGSYKGRATTRVYGDHSSDSLWLVARSGTENFTRLEVIGRNGSNAMFLDGTELTAPRLPSGSPWALEPGADRQFLALPDGGILAARATVRCGPYSGEPRIGWRHVWPIQSILEFDLECNYLIAEFHGTVTRVTGEGWITRGEKRIALEVGDRIFAGDVVSTGPRSSLKIECIDDTRVQLGALTVLEFQQIDKQEGSLIQVLNGLIRTKSRQEITIEKDPSRPPLIIRTGAGSGGIGVRGTVLTMVVERENGVETVTTTVDHGTADLLDPVTGAAVRTLTDGMSGRTSEVIPSRTLTIDHPAGEGGRLFLNDSEITHFPHVESVSWGTQLRLRARRDPGYVFRGWGGDENYPDPEYVVTLTGNLSLTANFEAFDLAGGRYPDCWPADTRYDEFQRLPELDVNHDGVRNGTAYAMGFLPFDDLPADLSARFPRPVASAAGRKIAMGFERPASAQEDVAFVLEASSEPGGDWAEIARKTATGPWTGAEAEAVREDVARHGWVPVTVENPALRDQAERGFLRMRVEVELESP